MTVPDTVDLYHITHVDNLLGIIQAGGLLANNSVAEDGYINIAHESIQRRQQKEGVHTLINLFRKEKSDQMEIVATLYACWEKLLHEGSKVSSDLLMERFYQWSEEKAKYPFERLKTAIAWMVEQGIVPNRRDVKHTEVK